MLPQEQLQKSQQEQQLEPRQFKPKELHQFQEDLFEDDEKIHLEKFNNSLKNRLKRETHDTSIEKQRILQEKVNNLEESLRIQQTQARQLREEKERQTECVIQLEKYLQAQQEKTKELQEEKERQTMCSKCRRNFKSCLLLPCSHILFCISCINEIRKEKNSCPHCQLPINAVMECTLVLQ